MDSALSLSVRTPRNAARTMSVIVAALSILVGGCGGGSSSGHPVLSGNTSVTLLASSTANDQLTQYTPKFTSLVLISQAGETATLLSAPMNPEFIHLNGTAEPLATVSIPQGVYTSATATLSAATFYCVNYNQPANSTYISQFGGGDLPASSITVTLPAPITITGSSMALSLDLLVSQSASFQSCDLGPFGSYSVTPTFTLTPITIASQPTNNTNGKMTGLEGLIASVDSSGFAFTVTSSDGLTWQVASGSSTVFQGITAFANLTKGMPVNMDVAIQSDGSLIATRVEVADTNTSNLTVFNGPALTVDAFAPVLSSFENTGQGTLAWLSYNDFDEANATYKISGEFTNLSSLPFVPIFTANTSFAGQNTSTTTHATTQPNGGSYLPATTITLLPQTINGTVTAVGNDGDFTTYTISLASYDLVPNLAPEGGEVQILKNPSTVVVYADSNTQLLDTGAPPVGSMVRFRGLLLDDNGTLRMDCDQINPGVAE